MLEPKVGQRWNFNNKFYNFNIEIFDIKNNGVMVRITQLFPSELSGYRVNEKMIISSNLFINDTNWSYLFGQDRI
jgi:hypothetical protein